ncbi:J domain-containing protein [Candidatus Woesearchaeota archaeon]|nr:J domain-containing protein [Candidatus Woesearchaeota archaeon]
MARIKIKGYEFDAISIRDSFNRRALKFKNNIISSLKQLGLPEDAVIVNLEAMPIKKAPASASWYYDGHHMHYSYKAGSKFVENLYVVSKLIEFEVNSVIEGKKTAEQFILDFSEEEDVEQERLKARELLGVEHDSLDLNLISKKYKQLAKDAHPDMPNGDTEKFKAINKAHKILKRELE